MPVSRLDSVMNSSQNLSPEFQKVFQASMIAERKPIQQLEEKKEKVTSKLGLLNDVIGKVENVKKALPDLSTPASMLEIAVKSNDDRVVTGVAEKGKAEIGEYSFEVAQLAAPASAMSNGFTDKNETRVGSGFLSITRPDGDTTEIYVDNNNATLEGLVNVINRAGVGVRASVVTDNSDPDNPYHLLLTGTDVGAEATFSYPDFYFVDGEEDLYIENERAPQNAIVKFQGQQFESATNEIKDIVPGVTVNLRGVSDGRPVTLHVDQDAEKTSVKIKELVDNLNEVFSFIEKQNNIDDKTDTSRTLGGEYSLRVTEQRLKTALYHSTAFDSTRKFRNLGDIGIQLTREGTLKLDEKKFQDAIKQDYNAVADILIGPDLQSGVIPKITRAMMTISSPGMGVLTNQKQTFTNENRRLDTEIDNKERFVEKKAESLRNKLAKAQGALAALQGQSQRISAGMPTQNPAGG